MPDPVSVRWQFCRAGTDITSQPLYAEQDADQARAWNHDFCVVAVRRDGYDPDRWRIASSDALPAAGGSLVFHNPGEALAYVSRRTGTAYQATTG